MAKSLFITQPVHATPHVDAGEPVEGRWKERVRSSER